MTNPSEHDTQSKKIPKELSELEESFALQLKTSGIEFEREFRFDRVRKWRVDFRILETFLLIEINGGTWMEKSGHSTAKGIQRDYEKSNAAQLLGYVYLQFTKKELDNLVALDTVRQWKQAHGLASIYEA
jgi:very-short-patch-repair endonuclease